MSPESFFFVLGLIAGILNTACFLPQAIKIIRTGSTKDLSLIMYSTLAAGTSLWVIYGFGLGLLPVWLPNSVALCLILTILFLKIKNG